MSRPTKRAQVEALGWKLTAIPRHFEAGLIRNSQTGYVSPAYDDYKRPEAWIVTPPPERAQPPRRFDNASPNPAVRWAWEQAMAAAPPSEVGGVAGLALLMASAGKSGVVAEGGAEPASPARPNAELLHLCREIAGCRRIAEDCRGGRICVWDQPTAFQAERDRSKAAHQDIERMVPRVIELEATTPAGALAKARVVAGLFGMGSGRRAEAVRVLVEDLVRVLGQSDPAP